MPITDSEFRKFRKLYSDILLGFSSFNYKEKNVYVKHFGHIDQGIIDNAYEEFYLEAVNNGVQTEKEKIDLLNTDKSWTFKDEEELEINRLEIINLKRTKENLILPSQKKEIQDRIDELDKKQQYKNTIKRNLIGLTAESYANKKINNVYVLSSVFKEKEFITPFFSEEEFDEMDDYELSDFITVYNKTLNQLNERHIKKISICAFVQNVYYFCQNDFYKFYGKAATDLTFYQIELFSNAQMYYKIFSENYDTIPDDIRDDPDALYEFYSGNKNAEKVAKATSKGDASAIVGATKEDMEKLGLSKPNSNKKGDLFDEASKKGGLSMEDLLKMHHG